jgi:hypothetical protein
VDSIPAAQDVASAAAPRRGRAHLRPARPPNAAKGYETQFGNFCALSGDNAGNPSHRALTSCEVPDPESNPRIAVCRIGVEKKGYRQQ